MENLSLSNLRGIFRLYTLPAWLRQEGKAISGAIRRNAGWFLNLQLALAPAALQNTAHVEN
jgi:hypothetical protein